VLFIEAVLAVLVTVPVVAVEAKITIGADN